MRSSEATVTVNNLLLNALGDQQRASAAWQAAFEGIARAMGYPLSDLSETYELAARIAELKGDTARAAKYRADGAAYQATAEFQRMSTFGFKERIDADFPPYPTGDN